MMLEIIIPSILAIAFVGWLGMRRARKSNPQSTEVIEKPLYRLDVKIGSDYEKPEAEATTTIEVEVEEPLSELPNLEGTLEFEPEDRMAPPVIEAKREVEVAVEITEEEPIAEREIAPESAPQETAPEKAPVAKDSTPEPEPIVEAVEATAPAPPQGLFARFTGGGAPKSTEPIDLSDADEAFDALDHEALASVEDLDPELGERLTALNQKLENLEGIVADLEDTLSIFDEEDLIESETPAEADQEDPAELAA